MFVDSVGDGFGGGRIGDSDLGGLPSAVDAAGKSVLQVARGLDPSEVSLISAPEVGLG